MPSMFPDGQEGVLAKAINIEEATTGYPPDILPSATKNSGWSERSAADSLVPRAWKLLLIPAGDGASVRS